MFVDASAIVAMIAGEPGADVLADRLAAASSAFTSPIAIFEATLAIRRIRSTTVGDARARVAAFLDIANVRVVALTPETSDVALDAFARYGKGAGHPARLNLGDCFAYACARITQAPLLYAGDDFSRTDAA